jgi:hypothetical protein
VPESDATGHLGEQAAAIDAGAGPGATAILQGMLETLSEVLGTLDQRLGRLEDRLDDVTASRNATAHAVAKLGNGMSHLAARFEELAREDDEPPPPPPPIEVDVDAVADAVASRLDGRLSPLSELGALGALAELHQLSRLDRLDSLDGLDQRLARLDDANGVLLDAVNERMAPLDSLGDDVAARVAGPVAEVVGRLDDVSAAVLDGVTQRLAPLDGLADEVTSRVVGQVEGLGEGMRVVLGRLGDLTASVDAVGSGLGSLSEALAADDGPDALDVAAVIADESERVRSIVAGLGQAITAAHGDITATVADEGERTRLALSEAVASAVDATAHRPELAAVVAEEGERTRAAVVAGVADLPTALSEEGERVRATVAAAGEATAEAVAGRVEVVLRDVAAALEHRHEAVAAALDSLAAAPAGAGIDVVERSLAAAQSDLRQALDDAVLLVVDRQDAHAATVRRAVDDLRTELARMAEGDDDGPDLAALVSEAAQSAEGSLARMHADLRGALEDVSRLVGDRSDVPDVAALASQVAEVSEHSVRRLHDDLRTTLDEVAAGLAERQESYAGQVQQALGSLTQAVGTVRTELSALAERPADDGPDVAALLDRHAAELRQAVDAVAAAVPPPPDIRGALDDALLVLADRQDRSTDELRQAIGRLRADLAALADADADDDDGPAVADLLARHAEDARDDLTRLETVLRGQVAEVSGRAGSITDVIGRLDGRLHEVVDGVRGLSRHLEATATLVPAVEALRAEVDELRRLYEQPRLRAVNGGD